MYILVLDDNELWIRAAEDHFVDPHDFRTDDIVQVACPDTFWQEYYKRDYWDEVWLDHDLGYHEYSGRTVTLAFYNDGKVHKARVGKFVVITNNPGAAKTMVSDLEWTGVTTIACPQSSMTALGIWRGEEIPFDQRHQPIIHTPKI